MSEIKEYKCPACGGAMEFDSKSQKMKCPYCDTEISVDEYESLIAKADQVVAADVASDVETEQKKSENYTAHDWNQDEIDNMVVYISVSLVAVKSRQIKIQALQLVRSAEIVLF